MARLFLVAGVTSVALTGPVAAQSPPRAPAPPAEVASGAAAPEAIAMSFEDAVSAGERAAESVAIARAEVDRARAQVTSARAGYLPTLNGSLGYQRTLATEFDDIVFGPPDPSAPEIDLPFGRPNNWRANMQLNQPLFDGFRTGAAIDAAKSGVQVSKLGVQSTRAQVVLQVAQAYFDAALAQRQVEIAEVTLQQAEQTFDETELLFKQGAAPEFDLVRAEVARDNQRTLLVQFKVQRDSVFVLLRRLVGLPVDRPLQLTSKLDADDIEQIAEAGRKAVGIPGPTRLAVAQAKEAVAIQEAQVRIARADLLPVVSAGTDLGFVNYENQPFNSDWRTNWTLGVTLSLPIFDGFRRRATIRSSEASLASARAQLQNASEASDVEVAQQRANVAASRTQLESSMRTVQQAQRAYEIAELRFSQGASTHLELVDARVQLEQALLVQARAARDLRVARLREELLPALPLGTLGF